MKSFRTSKVAYGYFSALLIFAILVLKFSYQYSPINDMVWLKINGAAGWVVLTWGVFSWKRLRNELLSPYLIYFVLLLLFTFGQSLLILFGLVHPSKDLLFRFHTHELINAQLFTLLCLTSFHFGALIACKAPNTPRSSDDTARYKADALRVNLMFEAIKYTGLILLVLSLPGFIYSSVVTLNRVISGGYMALYGYHTVGNVSRSGIARAIEQMAEFFIPSLICIVIGYRSSWKVRWFVFPVLLGNIANRLFIGGRSEAVVGLIIIVLTYHYSVKAIRKHTAIRLGLFSYIFVSFLSIVANLRSVVSKSVADYFIMFINSFGQESLFFRTITEIGWTMFPLGAVMNLIPTRYEYLYGKSYLFALTSIIPNLGFWEIHPAKVYAGGGQWLMDTLNLWSGPAFTLVADAYRNFGWGGFFALFGFGVLFGRIFSSVNKTTIQTKPELLCILLIFFEATLMSVRGDNLYIVRPSFFVVLPIFCLIEIIYLGLFRASSVFSHDNCPGSAQGV